MLKDTTLGYLALGCLLLTGDGVLDGPPSLSSAAQAARSEKPSKPDRKSNRQAIKVEKETVATIQYPQTRRGDTVDNYHGTSVEDPYRWLEDTNSEETATWVKDQNKTTFSYLEQIHAREPIRDRLTELWNYERFGRPYKRGGRYFFTHNDGLQNQSVLYTTESLDIEPRMLLDPNKLSEDGTVALAGWQPSRDGRLLAFGLAAAGSDWREWKLLDVESGRMLEDHLEWIKFSGVSWAGDNSGFYYSRYDEPAEGTEFSGTNHYQKLYFHTLGQPQSEDRLVYERKDEKEWGFGGQVTEDGRFLVLSVWKGTLRKNQLFYQDLENPDADVVELISGFDASYDFLGNVDGAFWIMTNREAPQRRIIRIDLEHSRPEDWEEIIPEQEDTLEDASMVGGRLVASYLHHAHSQVHVHSIDGELLRSVRLPGIGSASGFGGRQDDSETFFTFTNYTTPSTIYQYDVTTGRSTIYRQPQVDFEPGRYRTEQVFYESTDGTRIPMFLVYKKGMKRDGGNPTLLYGYGGFDISLTPGFSVVNLVWMEMGGVYAVANLRGGGEYGRRWHEAGMLENKQNVFDDFIAAAHWLVEEKITCRERLAIRGGSNGGLLVGAVMSQRPDLCSVALPAVGVMDMLRYHKFTIGWAWVSEYGSSDDETQFKNLVGYSPYHNLQKGTSYPATLVTTADHDDRVVPGHSFKFAAALQDAHQGPAPVLIRIETSAGHGAGTPTSKRIAAATDMLAFLARNLEIEQLPGKNKPAK